MNVSKVNDNKMFWKAVKTSFSNKFKTENTIVLLEGDKIMKHEKLIEDTFNDFFTHITKNWRNIQIFMVSFYLFTSKTPKVQ